MAGIKCTKTMGSFCALLSVALLFQAARARAGDVPKTCWTAQELAGTAVELAVLKGDDASPFRAKPPIADDPRRQPLDPRIKGLLTSVRPAGGAKKIALTFDLCEGSGERAGYDGRIVDYLRGNRIPATFFMGGKWARSHRTRALQLIADELFEVGNHSFSHAHPGKLDEAGLKAEILGAERELSSLRAELVKTGCGPAGAGAEGASPPPLFRFPYGEATEKALKFVNDSGLAAIQWNVAPGDPAKGLTPERLAEEILRKVRPGSIVVLHANGKGEKTAGALAIAAPELVRRGYEFVTVGELLASGEPVRE